MKTLGELFSQALEYCKKHPHVRRNDLETLFASNCGKSRLDLYLNFDKPVIESEVTKLREGLRRLVQHEPVEYVVGKVLFCGLELHVDKRVLIPRVETEELVEHIVRSLSSVESGTLVDMCTGSGAIGIAIKKRLPQLTVILSDVSTEALCAAQENAKQVGVEVICIHSDLFKDLPSSIDYLVSNPPYVSEKEYITLTPSVTQFEPKIALVSGPTGLEIYERIACVLPSSSVKQMWLEMGATQAESLSCLFSPIGKVEIISDTYSRDRFLCWCRSSFSHS